jgi:hypothetical protein
MQQLTPAANQAVQNLAQRYGVSFDAVTTLLAAVNAGGGSMAQFYHSELGGGGQWMRGGMTMVGDMFNSRLQSTVSGLCAELATLLGSEQVYEQPPPATAGSGFGFMAPGNNWWPAELGQPSSSGGQNDSRYAYFPGPRRLAVSRNGQVTVYDTLDHQIGGVQQQQGGSYGSQSFSSQFGTFGVESLPVVSSGGQASSSGSPFNQSSSSSQSSQYNQSSPDNQSSQYQSSYNQNDAAPGNYAPAPNYSAPQYPANNLAASNAPQSAPNPSSSSGDIIGAIERLGQLRERGILTDAEFNAKKADLLSRL